MFGSIYWISVFNNHKTKYDIDRCKVKFDNSKIGGTAFRYNRVFFSLKDLNFCSFKNLKNQDSCEFLCEQIFRIRLSQAVLKIKVSLDNVLK